MISSASNCIYKYIANFAKGFTPNKTVDTQIYDNKRLFRIPNTRHEKSGLYKIPITLNELQTLSIDQIREMAVKQRVIELQKEFLEPYVITNTSKEE